MAEAEKRMIQDDIISDDMLMVTSQELFKPNQSRMFRGSGNLVRVLMRICLLYCMVPEGRVRVGLSSNGSSIDVFTFFKLD